MIYHSNLTDPEPGRRTRRAEIFAALGAFCWVLLTHAAAAQTYSVPIRWCVIGDDANDNGVPDAGEEGAPAFINPGAVGEADTDNVLWRRHERTSDNTYIPQADVTLRSSIYNIVD
jgi:hypothetical protein